MRGLTSENPCNVIVYPTHRAHVQDLSVDKWGASTGGSPHPFKGENAQNQNNQKELLHPGKDERSYRFSWFGGSVSSKQFL